MKTPQVDTPWKYGIFNGNNVIRKKEDRQEADIQADEMLREEKTK